MYTFIAHLLLNKIKSNTEEQELEQTKGISESGCVHTRPHTHTHSSTAHSGSLPPYRQIACVIRTCLQFLVPDLNEIPGHHNNKFKQATITTLAKTNTTTRTHAQEEEDKSRFSSTK